MTLPVSATVVPIDKQVEDKQVDAFLAAKKATFNFLLTHLYMVLAWPLAALLLGIIGWGILLGNVEQNRRSAETVALQQAASLSRNYANHLARVFESIDQVLLHLRFEWNLSNGNLHLAEMNREKLFLSSPFVFAAVIDTDGVVISSTTAGRVGLSVLERPSFIAHRQTLEDMLHIAEPLWGRASKQYVVAFSRKIFDSNGRFGGLVQVGVVPSYLTENYDEIALGKNGFLGILGNDNATRAIRIGEKVYAGEAQALVTTPKFNTPGGNALFDGNEWFIDKRSRFIAWHPVPDYPLTAIAGLDKSEALAAYWTRRTDTFRNAILATIALAIFTCIAMALSLRLAWRRHQLETVKATYRMATEEGNEGFYIARPLRDRNGLIVDFEFIDCNHHGAKFFHLRREGLIGLRVSSLYEGAILERLMRRLRQAMDSGFYEGELNAPADSPGLIRWLHVKMVRSDGDLAITVQDISDAKAHVVELQRRSNEDPLTSLPNRYWIQTYLPKAIEHAKKRNTMLALLYVDLDGFKSINDTLGHPAGDELLRYAAARLRTAVRPQDHVVRLGGDEFVTILEHLITKDDAAPVAERILGAFDESFQLANGIRSLHASIGISVYPEDGTDADTLLQNSDLAMYSVKTSGKGHYQFFELHFREMLQARFEKELEIRNAIERDQFVLYYQPRVDVSTGITRSMEALVRWVHPDKGVMGPSEFISLAEETGLILELGELIIDKVCAQLACWKLAGQKLVPVSVNVSPRQIHETDISKIFLAAISRHNVDARLLEIEITESSMMGESEEIFKLLADIHAMGIKLSIDDFGTGYSSLAQLQQFDFDILKIDRAFVLAIDRTDEGRVFVNAIITMAHALSMSVVAEGVENQRQMMMLKELQCDEIQGYYISKPLPPSQLNSILQRQFFSSISGLEPVMNSSDAV